MKERLLELIRNIQSDKRLSTFDEAATKQAVILRILACLNWDTFNIDEVKPEYSVGGRRVDFSLRHNKYNKLFIEVKKIGEDLEKHQAQLLNYSFQEGVKLAILTNGITWWFYLPLNEGNWEQRKFYTIEIYDQDSEDIVQKFIDFIEKEYVITGKAVENAEKVHKGRQKQDLIVETLPKAWNRLIEETNEILIDLIAETAEKLCGHKPDFETVAKFISNINKTPITQYSKPVVAELPRTPRVKVESDRSYTNKQITSFVFKGTRYKVGTWKELLLQVCDIMLTNHRNNFDRVLNLVGKKRTYFTRDQKKLVSPQKINGIDMYVEVNFSANKIVSLSQDIISLFGYSAKDLAIEAQ